MWHWAESCSSKNWFTAARPGPGLTTSQLKYLNPFPEPQLTFLWPHKANQLIQASDWSRLITWPEYWPLIGQPTCHPIISPWFASPGVPARLESRWSVISRIFMFMILLILVKLWRVVGTGQWQGLSGARQMMPQIVYLFTSLFLSPSLRAFELNAYRMQRQFIKVAI